MAAVVVRRLSHVSLRVADLDRALDFYGRAFGYEVVVDQRGGALPGHETVIGVLGDTAVELVCDQQAAAGGATLSLTVDDLDASIEALRGEGIEVTPPIPFPQARACFFRDPDGNVCELLDLGARTLADVIGDGDDAN